MSDIEFYEKWCEYNKNNLPISFAEFCYEQGRADEQLASIEQAKEQAHECIMAIDKARVDERSKVLDEVETKLYENGFIWTEHAEKVWEDIKEQLKEQSNS